MKRRDFLAALAASPLFLQERTWKACVYGHTGRGGYGHGLDTCFQKIPGVSIAAVADPDEKGRAAAQKRLRLERSYASLEEMLDREKPDLVSLGPRWVEKRLEQLTLCAERKVHVYMEKPIAGSLAEADAMAALGDKHGIKIVVAHQMRLCPPILHLKQKIEEGLIGRLLEVRTRGKEDHRSGGEDLMVLGTHCLYLMRLFAGTPIWCSSRVTQDGREVVREDRRAASEPLGPVAGDTIHAQYAFADGVQGSFASQKVPKGEGGRFQLLLYGSKGVAGFAIDQDPKISWLPEPRWVKDASAWQPVPGTPSNDDPSGLKGTDACNKRVVEELIRLAVSGGPSPVEFQEARATLEMIHAVYTSHLSGARASFPLAAREHPLGTL